MELGGFLRTLIRCGLILGSLVSSSLAFAQASSDPSAWLNSLPTPEGVHEEIAKFGGLPDSYIQNLPVLLKQQMIRELRSTLAGDLQIGTCQEKISISFPNPLTPAARTNPKIAEFESQFVRIEMIKCFPNVKASRVAEVYVSSPFQSTAFDTVVDHQQNGNRICQATYAFGVGRSEYCFNQMLHHTAAASFVHSYNDFNTDGIEAPVYYREMLSAAYDLPQGTLFYSNVYVRSISISSLLRNLARGKIRGSQERAMGVLNSLSQK